MMAQHIVTLCDPCLLHDGKESPAQTWEVTVREPGGSKPVAYEIDACEKHASPITALLHALTEDGRKRGARTAPVPLAALAARDGKAHPCPLCGHGLGTRDSLRSHVERLHGTSLGAVENPDDRMPCPADGCDFVASKGQGLSAHIRSTHGDAFSRDQAREAVQAAVAARNARG